MSCFKEDLSKKKKKAKPYFDGLVLQFEIFKGRNVEL